MTNSPHTNDYALGFLLQKSGIRGRLVRLGGAVSSIIKRHEYPESVAALLAETLALSVALATSLKYEGMFTLQTKGDGPVSLMVADVGSDGAMRAYAQFDAEKIKHAGVRSALLLGKGHLAFTVDTGEQEDRYQGIVELIGRDMAACIKTYFRQSEQIDSEIVVHAGMHEGEWHAGVVLLQRMPEGGGYAANNNAEGGMEANEARMEDWRRSSILLNTLTEKELLDPKLAPAQLLHRLFHEENLQITETRELRDQCRCSRSRVARMLSTIPQGEMPDLMVDGLVRVKCEFCSAVYDFDGEQLKQLEAGPGVRN
jgi:molecular chaperone Hsp33